MFKTAAKSAFFALALALGMVLAQPARATTYTYSFNQLAGGGAIAPVASLSISDIVGGAEFTLTGSFNWLSSSAFLSELWFNGPTAVGSVVHVAGNAFDDAPHAHSPSITNAGYQFSWHATFPVANSPGTDRFLGGDFSTWRILGDGIHAASFILPMMVHIQGIPQGEGDYSIKVVAVPEPSTAMLLLAGLGLLGFMARRRMRD